MKFKIGKEMLFLSEEDVKKCITMKEAVKLAEEGIKADATGKVEGNKFYMDLDKGFIKPFSGLIKGKGEAFVKIFTLFPDNQKKGLPTTTNLVILYDAYTGVPLSLMEANWVTGAKTGASSAVTAKFLANPESSSVAIVGAGLQGRTHLEGLSCLFNLEEARVYDVDFKASLKYAEEMSGKLDLTVKPVNSPRKAIVGADIVYTVTTANEPIVKGEWLKPGVFLAKLGSWQELDLNVFSHVDKVVVDRWLYVSHRVPELRKLINEGKISREDIYAEYPEIVAGEKRGREAKDEKILYIALGIWGEYAAILPYIYRKAVELGIGKKIKLSF